LESKASSAAAAFVPGEVISFLRFALAVDLFFVFRVLENQHEPMKYWKRFLILWVNSCAFSVEEYAYSIFLFVISLNCVMKKLLFIAVLMMLVGAGCWSRESDAPTETLPMTNSEQNSTGETQATGTGSGVQLYSSLNVSAQNAGTRVGLDAVVLAKPGFVVIRQDVAGKPGKVIGTSAFLQAGEMHGVTVMAVTKAGMSYWAELRADDGDGKFAEAKDAAVVDERNGAVSVKFSTVGSSAAR